MKRIIKLLSLIFLINILLYGCGVYTFTGASIPPEAKTISVFYFENKAALVEATLSQTLTDALRDRFASQTTLDLVERDGDLHLEGEITEYRTQPIAIQGDQTAALNRLTIKVKVKFVNLFDDSKNFDTEFSRYEDYPSSEDLSSVQAGLIELITEALVEDIFNQAVVNW